MASQLEAAFEYGLSASIPTSRASQSQLGVSFKSSSKTMLRLREGLQEV